MSVFPNALYRGDDDNEAIRKLRSSIQSGMIYTNILNALVENEISSYSYIQLAVKHITTKWGRTHFLSFSECEKIAFKYGSRNRDNFDRYYEDDSQWNFAMFTLSTSIFIDTTIKEIQKGVYISAFDANLKTFAPRYFVYLIDTLKVLQSAPADFPGLKLALEKAETDKEWLLLPAMPMRDFPNHNSAILDASCFSDVRYYKFGD